MRIEKSTLMNPKKTKDTNALYYVIDEFEERYLQIDTFGSNQRKYPEKVSQSIRINKLIAKELKLILEETFDI